MEHLRKEYSIAFTGLKQGKHEFDFHIGDKFFDEIEYSPIKKADILLKVTLLKQETMLILEFNFDGTVNVQCDVCTDMFDLPVNGNNRLIVKLGKEDEMENEDEIISLPNEESSFNIEPYIYEYITLNLPLKKVHPADKNGKLTCNEQMVELLEKLSRKNNSEENTDPRWDVLKNLSSKN